jgi:hypothetical protein
MIKDFCVIINTVSSCSDIWEMLVNQLNINFPNQKVYVFTDENSPLFEGFEVVIYDKNLDFRTQYLNCLKHVKESTCLNMNDDYILYEKVNVDEISKLVDVIKNDDKISFVRVAKGYNNTNDEYTKNLYYLSLDQEFFYSQTTAIWKKDILLRIHQDSPKSSIGRKDNLPQLEVVANNVCRKLKLSGLYYYNNEPMRGSAHYDSSIFPYIASALVAGKWNIKEYPKEMEELVSKYKINLNNRGTF